MLVWEAPAKLPRPKEMPSPPAESVKITNVCCLELFVMQRKLTNTITVILTLLTMLHHDKLACWKESTLMTVKR